MRRDTDRSGEREGLKGAKGVRGSGDIQGLGEGNK